jgi:T6SS, Phospholipase effector Tle1-like, catalytic domain
VNSIPSTLLAAGPILAGVSYGALFGTAFGPLRLAGVDFSKWYSDPGEISERADRTWIGLIKQTALGSARYLLGLALLVWAGWEIWGTSVRATANASAGQAAGWTYWPLVVLGALVGVVVCQAAFELLWRQQLHRRRQPTEQRQIMLARPPGQQRQRVSAPLAPDRRRLIVCCDGTWNSPMEKQETNVVHLLRSIQPDTQVGGVSIPQISYYHLGVGTGNFLDRFLGGGAGIGLSSSVKACYAFLADNYREGDEISLFGFSRGAYVVRSVAGLIGLVGLLQKGEMFQFAQAWDYYRLPRGQRCPALLDKIAPRRHREVEIACLGVWDTVGALGIPGSRVFSKDYAFHDTSLGTHVRHAFQALAIDERRGNFQPAIWVKNEPDQVLDQVWFPGVHSNVGGGYRQHGLSDMTLLWMLSQLQRYGLIGIDVQAVTDAIGRFHAEPTLTANIGDSRRFLWKMIGCPIPRPVGITDPSEMIHVTAEQRSGAARAGDPYESPNRRDWLESIPEEKIWQLGDFEKAYTYQSHGPGMRPPTFVHIRRSLSDWLLRRLFGEA